MRPSVQVMAMIPSTRGLTTERMSRQQADLLTTELKNYRRILTPVIEKIGRTYLQCCGSGAPFQVVRPMVGLSRVARWESSSAAVLPVTA